MELIGMEVFDPYNPCLAFKSFLPFDSLIELWITNGKAGYIRV